MKPFATATPGSGRLQRWLQSGGIAVVAIAAGLLLPRLLAGTNMPLSAQSTPQAAQAGSDLQYTPPVLPDAPDPADILLRLGGTTVVLLGGAVLVLWCCQRWLKAVPRAGAQGGQHLKLLDSLAVGNRCHIYLLQVDARQVLVGTDPSGLQTVVPLPELFASAVSATEEADEAAATA